MLFSPKVLPTTNSKPPFLYLKTSNQKTNKQKETGQTSHYTHRDMDTQKQKLFRLLNFC